MLSIVIGEREPSVSEEFEFKYFSLVANSV